MNRGWTRFFFQPWQACCQWCLPSLSTLAFSEPALAQTAQSYRQQATEFARSKSWDEAIAAYRKALDLDPNDALTHYDLALALKYKGDTKQAVEEFESATQTQARLGRCPLRFGCLPL